MKINADLRMAVRSAYNGQKKSLNGSWDVRHKAEQAAVEAFLSAHPKARKDLLAARARINKANQEVHDAGQVIKSFGLEVGYNGEAYRMGDAKAFIKAGGHFKFTESQKWSFDQVMAELAGASEKNATAILKRYGIVWS